MNLNVLRSLSDGWSLIRQLVSWLCCCCHHRCHCWASLSLLLFVSVARSQHDVVTASRAVCVVACLLLLPVTGPVYQVYDPVRLCVYVTAPANPTFIQQQRKKGEKLCTWTRLVLHVSLIPGNANLFVLLFLKGSG